MPTYEYACSSCHHEWEAEQSIKEAALTDCPQCHNATAKRQISRGTGFILKGSGWYSDLYAGSSNKTPEKGAEKPSAAAASSSESAGSTSSTGSSSSTSDSGGSSSSTTSTPSSSTTTT
ncbi:FmdB family zinc ribbon protein [Chondromyces apiculatus]|uniref:FmdB family zinc ribbon protein n=1 Tax=Chondromyces apiculatus TaxID=51 RepID=UPI0005C5DF9D|nr:zinc ribbon domain-containing protein [Chondromyces apiculatus]